jgi:hypothetical protein
MEVERYTLATSETAVTGFQRLWKPLGLVGHRGRDVGRLGA